MKAFAIRKSLMKYADRRSKMINEYFTGIKIIKYYAWEDMVTKNIADNRAKESVKIVDTFSLRALIELILNSVPMLIAVTVFGIYIGTGNELKPS